MLGGRVSLIGGQFLPSERLKIILRHPETRTVHMGKVMLSLRVALISRHSIQSSGFLNISIDA